LAKRRSGELILIRNSEAKQKGSKTLVHALLPEQIARLVPLALDGLQKAEQMPSQSRTAASRQSWHVPMKAAPLGASRRPKK